ncbi:MAG: hypothetical protein COA57_02550 [Flavobacteriales bacterium]|nr:MAG: hypothetical protein COA57_02550 [Flavobacteriales bacterium]
MMKKASIIFYILYFTSAIFAQQPLPIGFAPGEKALMPAYLESRAKAVSGITTPPTSPVRTMAEWEESQAIAITWTSYPSILKEIVRYAKLEVLVIIICSDSNQVKNYLSSNGIDSQNVSFIEKNYDSVWIRDYGQHTVYTNEVDSLLLVDWIYNRPRPDDDVTPGAIANFFGYPLYSTTAPPYDFVSTGGNFMSDGFGNAFSSKLVLEENEPGATYSIIPKTEDEIDSIMYQYMGIENYIKMEVLPYDGIHHIDMHMKLLDEETLLVGEYPSGVADGPQIEANLQYVLSNFKTKWGTDFKLVRIQMPPDANGDYPDTWWADYRTFTNSIFVNKAILVPIYAEQYDTTALRIYRENLPGYNIVGIDCNQIIPAGGALHCITKLVGAENPLLISHKELDDQYESSSSYQVDAYINHKTDISSASVFYTIDTAAGYQAVSMSLTNVVNHTWTGDIPAQPAGSRVFYYIDATANLGKQQMRPMTAPNGYWVFNVLQGAGMNDEMSADIAFDAVFPNPAHAITCIPVSSEKNTNISLKLTDVLGKEVLTIYIGILPKGGDKFFFDASKLSSGTYLLTLESEEGRLTQKVLVW